MAIYRLKSTTKKVKINNNNCKIVLYNNTHVWPTGYSVVLTGNNCTVSGTGVYKYGEVVTISCTPIEHSTFIGWSDGNTNMTRTITITDDVNLTANCAMEQCVVALSTITENITLTGAGTYDYGTTCSISANLPTGYRWEGWFDENNNIVTGNRSFTFTVNDNINLEAKYTHIEYTITASATNGTVTGGGTFYYGDTCTLTCTPNEGYKFDTWSTGSSRNPFVFTVNSSRNYTANCVEKTYNVTVEYDSFAKMTGGGEYHLGDICTVKCTTYRDDYIFKGLLDSKNNLLTTDEEYTFTVTDDISIIVWLVSKTSEIYVSNNNARFYSGETITVNNPLGYKNNDSIKYYDNTAVFTIVNNAPVYTVTVTSNRAASSGTYFWIKIGDNEYTFNDTSAHTYPWANTIHCGYYYN